jgi:sulfur carrier protein ThiS
MKIWTTLTGEKDVKVHTSRKDAVDELIAFLKGCDDERVVTQDNWQDALAGLNRDLDEAGEAHYQAEIAEHDLPDPRIVVEVSGDAVHRIHTDSPVLDGIEAAVITSGLDVADEDLMEISVGGGAPGEYTGALMAVEKATGWDAGSAYEAIESKASLNGMRR